MFKVGGQLIYGTNGVCNVTEIRSCPYDPADTRLYYVLQPLYDTANSVIYTPVENPNVVIRELVSKEEALKILEEAVNIAEVFVQDEKKRRETYRSIVQSTDLRGYISLIKAVNRRRIEFRKTRRRLPDLDNDFEHTARNALFGELAESLNIGREEVYRMIEKILGNE